MLTGGSKAMMSASQNDHVILHTMKDDWLGTTFPIMHWLSQGVRM